MEEYLEDYEVYDDNGNCVGCLQLPETLTFEAMPKILEIDGYYYNIETIASFKKENEIPVESNTHVEPAAEYKVALNKICPSCKKKKVLEVSLIAYNMWRAGVLVQNAFPELSGADRECLVSGYCSDCYDAIFDPKTKHYDSYIPKEDE